MTEEHDFLKETDVLRRLRILEAIEESPQVSQRFLADRLGVAVGVANACVHALVRKGAVKIHGENNRSITYHLTKRGVLYKSRLALEWSRNTLDFYQEARRDISKRLEAAVGEGFHRVVLFGAPEQIEIASIIAPGVGMTVEAVVQEDGGYLGDSVAGAPVVTLDVLMDIEADAVVLLGEVDDSSLGSLRDMLETSNPELTVLDLDGGEQ